MYYLLINQEVEGSLQLSDLAYELTDMGGYDKALDDYKRDYIVEYKAQEKAEIDELKAQHREKVKQDRAQAKAEGRKYVTEKKEFPTVKGPINEIDGGDFNYEWIPLRSDLHPYASGDVDAGLRIHNRLDKIGQKPEHSELRRLYTRHYPELVNYLAKLETNGIQMDTDYTDNLADKYLEEEERLEKEMSIFPEVRQVEAEHQKLYERGLQEWAIPKKDRDLEVAKLRDRYKNKLTFNPNSPDDKKKVLYKVTGINLPYNKEFLVDSVTENNIPEEEINWSHYKTDKTALEYIKDHFKDHADLADMLLTHSLVKTRRRGFTYKLREMVDHLGILHGGFNATGTACVKGDTLLITSEGIKEIQQVDNNREEGTFTDIDFNIHSHEGVEKADGFYYSGLREGVNILLADGTEITTTPNHPLLKQQYLSQKKQFNKKNKIFQEHLKNVEWEKAEDIRVGDYLTLKVGTHLYGDKEDIDGKGLSLSHSPTSHTKQATLPTKVTLELAEWLGMYMADGNYDNHNGSFNIYISHSKEEVLSRFTTLNKKLFNLDTGRVDSKGKSPKAYISSVYLGKWFEEIIKLPTGAINKDVPNVVLEGTKEVQEAFIRGLSLDSSVQKKRYPSIYFSSISHKMMDKVRVMLMNMGMYASVRVRASYTENRLPTKEVILAYDSVKRFVDDVGFIEVDKQLITNRKLKDYTEIVGKRIGVIETPKYVFVKVDKIETARAEFFDLHVPQSHSFIGNSVVNHNTTRLSAQNPK